MWMNGQWGPNRIKERQGRTRTLASLMKGEKGELRASGTKGSVVPLGHEATGRRAQSRRPRCQKKHNYTNNY